MQAIFGKCWGSAEAKTFKFEGEDALKKALEAREKSPEPNTNFGGKVVFRNSPNEVWRWENDTPIEDKYIYNNKALNEIWDN